jgi:hypothetical protein
MENFYDVRARQETPAPPYKPRGNGCENVLAADLHAWDVDGTDMVFLEQ